MTVTKQDIEAAARRCVALDDSGQFPANSPLGLFEVETARAAAAPRTTAASVEYTPRPGLRNAGSAADGGKVGIRLLLEVDSAEGRRHEGGGNPSPGFDTTRNAGGGSAPTRTDLEMAVTGAAATVGGDPAEAQVAISGLAAWNLMMVSSAQENAEQARTTLVYVEVGAALGHHGDWYTAGEFVTVTDGGAGDGAVRSSGSLLSSTCDFEPKGEVWAKLDGPVVADVKVFVAGQSAPAGNDELLLLHATLCKRASSVVGGWGRGITSEAAATSVDALRATLVPHAEQKAYVRQQQSGHTGDPADSVESAAAETPSPPGPFVTISEIEDGDWWRAREEEAYGRGMNAVNALPRLAGWKPGDWKKRRERRRKQELERERRRAEKTARRRSDREGGGGGGRTGATSRRGESAKGGQKARWSRVKGVWRAIGRGWRRARRKFSRRKRGE